MSVLVMIQLVVSLALLASAVGSAITIDRLRKERDYWRSLFDGEDIGRLIVLMHAHQGKIEHTVYASNISSRPVHRRWHVNVAGFGHDDPDLRVAARAVMRMVEARFAPDPLALPEDVP